MPASRNVASRTLGLAAMALSAALLVPGVALAGSAQTAVGSLTTTFAPPCNDMGAPVYIALSGGFPGATYTVSTAQGLDPVGTFVADVNGAGEGYIHNAKPDSGSFAGVATVTVTANGQTGTVPVQIDCPDPKGD